jgi:glycosyltransferase involved in cell wall biosynthesis
MKIFWTVHNLRPHERDHPLLERIFWHMFLPNVDGLICMSESGKEQLYRQHARARAHPVYVIPHGHYRGVYPDSMGREHARRALGVKPDEIVVAFLGLIRSYKGVPQLIRCFTASGMTNTRLVIAGRPHTDSIARELKEVADGNPNVQFFLDFVDHDDVQKFMRAADLVALPYKEILNSGSAILALSFDRPILVPAAGALAELYEMVGPEWIRLYEGELRPETIRDAVEWAVARQRQDRNSAPLQQLNWDRIAELTIEAFSR